jgi:hypothetical protein
MNKFDYWVILRNEALHRADLIGEWCMLNLGSRRRRLLLRDPVRPGFPRCSPGLVSLKELCPGVPLNTVLDARYRGVFQVIKFDIYDNVYEHSDFPTLGENIYRSRRAVNWLLIGRRGIGRCVDE